jgi:hypothetical protein
MLPLQRSPKDVKKRADGHLWPKGTFLQFKRGENEKVLRINQRKQQSHDLSEWKGMSHPFDLTNEVTNTKVSFDIKMCAKEEVENSSPNDGVSRGSLAGSYALHIAVCEYVSPDDLYDELMGNSPGGVVTIPKISLRSGKKRAKEYIASQMVSMIDSDDEDDAPENAQEECRSLTFSLLCPISKTAMRTPVRGRHCKHMQCFDLKNFLHSNERMSGGRWRCGACESFVSVRDLVHCGLFQAMVDTLGDQVSGARDKVSIRPDGTWKLMDENKLRYSKQKRGGSSAATKTENDVQTNDKSAELEVIELL